MPAACSPPKSQRVTQHYRARPRRTAARGPKAGQTYYVAESAGGQACGHHHRTLSGAHACAKRKNRAARNTGRAGGYVTERRKA